MNEEKIKKLNDVISECIDELEKDIETYYYKVNKIKEYEVSKIVKEKFKMVEDECAKIMKKHSIYIPADEFYRTLLFSLENAWAKNVEKYKLIPVFQDFKLSIEKYIYYDLIKKENIEKCAFEIKVEFNLKKIQYINDNNETIDFSYDIDENTYDEYEETKNDTENTIDEKIKENIEKFEEFLEFIIKKIEDCDRFTILNLSNWVSKEFERNNNVVDGGHRNVILIENTDNVIYFNHYEPHGSETDYLYDERIDLFETLEIFIMKIISKKEFRKINIKTDLHMLNKELSNVEKKIVSKKTKLKDTENLKKVLELTSLNEKLEKIKNTKTELENELLELKNYKIKKIEIEPFSASSCIGIQTFLSEYDKYGYCSLFSFFWLYLVLKCFFHMKEKYNNIPPINTWVNNVEKLLIEKFKNKKQKLYKLVTIFAYKLFSNCYSSEIVTQNDKIFITIIQRGYMENIFDKYKDEIKNKKIKLYTKNILEKVNKKKCIKKRIESDIIVTNNFDEDKGIEIEERNSLVEQNKEIDGDEGPIPPGYDDFDDNFDDRYENKEDDFEKVEEGEEFEIENIEEDGFVNNIDNLSDEEKRKILEDIYGPEILNIDEGDYEGHYIEEPRQYEDYNYGDIDNDMTVELVDEN